MDTIVPSADQERAAIMLHALGNPVRVAIMRYIVEHPGCIGNDLVLRFGRAQATISKHLAVLCRAQLVDTEREGHSTCYMLNQEALVWLLAEMSQLSSNAWQEAGEQKPKGSNQ